MTAFFVVLHISAGTIGLVSGFLSMLFRKGSGLHRAAGQVFFVSMLIMSGDGAALAVYRSQTVNAIMGTLTFYVVLTGWLAGRRRDGGIVGFDRVAVLVPLAVGTALYSLGVRAAGGHRTDGFATAFFFVFGTFAFLFAASDVRMLLRGGVSGAQRIARHVWRMCFALLVATASLYPGQAKLFPKWLRATNLLLVPHVLLIGGAAWWLVRLGSRKRVRARQSVAEPLPAR